VAEKRSRWETDREWAAWTIRDEIYGYIRNHWVPTIVTFIAGILGSLCSFIWSHPTWGIIIFMPTLTVIVLAVLARIDGKRGAADISPHPSDPRPTAEPPRSQPQPKAVATPPIGPPKPPGGPPIPSLTLPPTPGISAKANLSQGAKYYESFKSSRPFADLMEGEWVKLGTLYQRDSVSDILSMENREALKLRFPPDCPDIDRPGFTLLLLIFGYRQIYRADEVMARSLETGLYLSGCRRHAEVPAIEILVGHIFSKKDLLDVDEVVKSPILVGFVSKKIRLSKGGFYRLTDIGLTRAVAMFEDLVERA
jgi:hypothetical protein